MATLEKISQRIFKTIITFPKLIICLLCILTATLALQVKSISFDGSSEKLLSQSNPAFKTYLQFKQNYQAGLSIILLIEDNNIFSAPFLQNLDHLQSDLLDHVPYIHTVESLLTSRRVVGDNDNLYFDTLIPSQCDQACIDESRQIALNTPYYLNHIINHQGDATALILKMQPFIYSAESGQSRQLLQTEMNEIIDSIHKVINNHQANFSGQLSVGGPSIATIEMVNASKHDVAIFSTLALLVIACVLAFIFRRISAVLLPLFLLSLSISITVSLMLIADVPIQNVSSILPSFLLAVCVCDSIHFLQVFYKQFDAGLNKKAAILYAFNHTKVALSFTTITTAAGLIAFTSSAITPIANFGLFAAIGVIIALIFTFSCLPTLILLSPLKSRPVSTTSHEKWDAFLCQFILLIQSKAKLIVFLSFILLLISGYFISQLKLSHDTLAWFPEDNKARLAVERIDEKLTGTMPLELLIDSGESNGIYNPLFLQQLDNWLEQLQQHDINGIKIRNNVSLINLIKEVNAVLSQDKQYQLPNSRELIAQEILLIEIDAQDQVSALTDPSYRQLRISLSTSWQDAIYYHHFIKSIENSFHEQFEAPVSLVTTGVIALSSQIIIEMMTGMIDSYLLAGGMVSLFIILLLRNIKLGAIMMLPNLLPISLILGFMSLSNTPLDMFTLLIGAIAIGIIVDDSIHFTHGFQRAYKKSGSSVLAIKQTFNEEGRALFITTVVLCAGFLVYLFSALNNLQNFGLLTSFCIFLAFIADIILAPALIFLIYKDKKQPLH